MNLKDKTEIFQKMMEIIEKNNLEELTIAVDDFSISIKRGVERPQDFSSIILPDAAAADEKKDHREGVFPVVSPIAGVFYNSPSPGSPPYVEIGDNVKSGQIICIIEAMKVMNEISSDCSGRIIEILAKNGEPVRQGQELFLIEPASGVGSQ